MPSPRPSLIEPLVEESEELERRMGLFQGDEAEATSVALTQLRTAYRNWHTRARRILSPEAQVKFDEHRDGGVFNFGIAAFLNDPCKHSDVRAEDGSYPFGQWQYPFENLRPRLEKQRTLLLEAAPDESPAELVATELAGVLRRVPELLGTLQRRRPDWPIAQTIRDERELQVIIEALLRTLFDDVRPEDYVSSKGGANSRVDFVLPEVRVVVETKMIREGLTARRLGEELLVDAGRYPSHPQCEAIVAFVYDPNRRLENPKGLERDLTGRTSGGLSFICVISS